MDIKKEFGTVTRRLDGSYVIQRNGMPYHVPSSDPLFAEVERYALEHPDKVTREQPPEPPTLDEAKAAKLKEIAEARWKAEVKDGVAFSGYRMHTDRDSQAKYTGAVVAYTATGSFPTQWKGLDGWLPIPDGDTLLALASTVISHVEACFARENELSVQVDAARNIEEVDAISW